jgi:hypothetical protein
VRDRYLGAVDSYELYDDPAPGIEVFSSTALVEKAVSDAEIIRQRINTPQPHARHRRRRNFLDSTMNAPAPPIP